MTSTFNVSLPHAVQAGLYTHMHIFNMYVYEYIKCAAVDMLVNDLIMPGITAFHITEYVCFTTWRILAPYIPLCL